jgi:hypothetical protein
MTDGLVGTAPTILGDAAQISAEKAALRLLRDPDVVAVQEELKAELATWPRGREGDGAERIDIDVLQWTAGVIIDEISYLLREQPAFVIGTDTTPRRWFGHTFPGNGKSGDNPDAIYRSTVIDGTGVYEVTGQVDPSKPLVQLLFSIAGGTMTHPVKVENTSGQPNPDAGIMSILGQLDEKDLNIGPDGSFRLIVGGERTAGNWLPTKPAPCAFGCRQIVMDWTTTPLRLTLKRLDRQAPSTLDFAELKATVLADLANVVRFWAGFPDVWLGGVAVNSFAPPAVREGGWGFIGGVHFKLAPGEAAVVKVHPGQAAYMGFQLTDPWMLSPDNGRRQACLNQAQSTPDADGRYTYVISPVDPGVANWLDTCGLNQGLGLMRWQGFPGGASDNSGLFHGFRIVKLSEIDALEGVARVTPEERSKRLAARRDSYFSRFAAV